MALKFSRASWPLSLLNSMNIGGSFIFFFWAKKAKTRNSNNVRDVFIANNNLRESMTAPDESSIVSFHFAILYHIQQPYDAWAACQISWPSLFLRARAAVKLRGSFKTSPLLP